MLKILKQGIVKKFQDGNIQAVASFLFGILGIIWSFILACFNGNVVTVILAFIIIGPAATLSLTVIGLMILAGSFWLPLILQLILLFTNVVLIVAGTHR